MTRYGDWSQTLTGRRFYVFDPHPDDIVIEDIAGSCAKICRFNGHSTVFYSVAQHCVVGSYIVEARTQNLLLALGFLLHDSGEPYVGDMTRPLKRMPEMEAYRNAESNINQVLAKKFGVDLEHHIIKEVDDEMLATERKYFMVPLEGWHLKHEPLDIKLKQWTWQRAQREYLNRYYELCLRLDGVPKLATTILKHTRLLKLSTIAFSSRAG
jgi:uncharacterized protein